MEFTFGFLQSLDRNILPMMENQMEKKWEIEWTLDDSGLVLRVFIGMTTSFMVLDSCITLV